MKLNIGAGDSELPGFTPVDRKGGHEAYPLSFPDNSVEEVYASHVLEHFPRRKVQDVIADWVRVLRPGGRIRIAVPDFEWAARKYLERDPSANIAGVLMGGQIDDDDYHKAAFDYDGLMVMMQRAGLVCIKPFKPEYADCSRHPCSLNLEGFKPSESCITLSSKIVAIASTPRLGFQDNFISAFAALGSLGIEMHRVTGAYWTQCMERVLSRESQRAEWVLTVDYDTIFDVTTVQRLAMLADLYPEADAIAPLQVKREEASPLLSLGREATLRDLRDEMVEVDWAHFGCTLIRADALKKMPHPWFAGDPGPNKDWGEGRTDDDIAFWRGFRKAGNRAYVATRVPVGHLQLMVSWPGEDMKPIHQYVAEYWNEGPPSQVRC